MEHSIYLVLYLAVLMCGAYALTECVRAADAEARTAAAMWAPLGVAAAFTAIWLLIRMVGAP